MNDDADDLRRQLAELRSRLERNERLLDRAIGTLALTTSATQALWDVLPRHYSPKSEGDRHAAGMTFRGLNSTMQGAMRNLRREVENSPDG